MIKLIDVSEWNEDLNLIEAAKDVQGIIIRAGYGKGHVDGYSTVNIQRAIAANMPYMGVYWFSYAVSPEEARREADECFNQIRYFKDKINLPVFIDFEEDSINWMEKCRIYPTKELLTSIVAAFCDRITELGLEAGYYSNYSNYRDYFDSEELKKYKLWFAWWDDEGIPEGIKAYIHQFTDQGHIRGCGGSVDVNYILDPEEVKDKYYTVNDVVRGIWNGDFGNGDERKENLYNYFQSKVNEGRPE